MTVKEKRRILIIDDDQISCIAIAKQLEKRDYLVATINNPFKALEKIEQFCPELILLDIVMPEQSGIDLLKNIRQIYSPVEMPILMLSANKEDTDIVEALNYGANDYLTKPMNIQIAEARINTAFNSKDATAKLASLSQMKAINAMVITYNHEFNNPLSIAQIGLGLLKKSHNDKNVERIETALQRITDIVVKIKNLATDQPVEFEQYAGNTSMIKLDEQ